MALASPLRSRDALSSFFSLTLRSVQPIIGLFKRPQQLEEGQPSLASKENMSAASPVAASKAQMYASSPHPAMKRPLSPSEPLPMLSQNSPTKRSGFWRNDFAEAAPARDFSTPQERFDVQQVLQDSLFGKVLTAIDRKTNKTVAIKLSNMQLVKQGRTVAGGQVLENPLNEAKMMSKVCSEGDSHPNVVQMVEEFSDNNVHWLVMEYAPCGEFFDLLARQGTLDEDHCKFYFRQMLSALEHLHSRNVCHLDFSMENLLLDEDMNIKLTDFGVAREVSGDGRFAPIMTEKPGKLRYMAPEILHSLEFDGRSADVFALGVTLFCMLTGNAPFEAASRKDKRWEMIADGQMLEMLRILQLDSYVSPLALDLLKGLLSYEKGRFTLQQVKNHPWLRSKSKYEQSF